MSITIPTVSYLLHIKVFTAKEICRFRCGIIHSANGSDFVDNRDFNHNRLSHDEQMIYCSSASLA